MLENEVEEEEEDHFPVEKQDMLCNFKISVRLVLVPVLLHGTNLVEWLHFHLLPVNSSILP